MRIIWEQAGAKPPRRPLGETHPKRSYVCIGEEYDQADEGLPCDLLS
jgi:hypothetical protein